MIFTGAHQNMGYDRLMNTFSYLKNNIQSMASDIASAAEARSLKQIQEIIQVWPCFLVWANTGVTPAGPGDAERGRILRLADPV